MRNWIDKDLNRQCIFVAAVLLVLTTCVCGEAVLAFGQTQSPVSASLRFAAVKEKSSGALQNAAEQRPSPTGPIGAVVSAPFKQFFPSQTDIRAPIVGSHPYLNVLVKFADTADITPHPKAYYETLIGGEVGGLDHYFKEISYGKLSLFGSRTVDWITLSKPKAAYLLDGAEGKPWWRNQTLMQEAFDKLASQVDLSKYYGVNFFPNVTDGMNASQWTLWFTVSGGKRAVPVTLINPQCALPGLVAHEMGHNFGFDHTCLYRADGKLDMPSPWTTMGDAYKNRVPCEFIAYHKLRAGWIEPARIYEARPGSTQTLRIERLALPTNDKEALVARIPIAGAVGEYYTVEARRYAGYDTRETIPGEGVVIHRIDESMFDPAPAPPIFQFAARCVRSPGGKAYWSPGESFSDPKAGVTVSIGPKDGSGYTITVTVQAAPISPGVVTTAAEDGAGSLRDALVYAQHHPGTKIRFDIPRTDPHLKNGVFTLSLTRPLPYLLADGTELIAPTQAENGYAAGGKSPGIFLDGSGISVPQSGIVFHAGRCVVRNMAIGNFNFAGITLNGQQTRGNRIESCFIGTDAVGRQARPNRSFGILIEEGAQAEIKACLVSGNTTHGIVVNSLWNNGQLGMTALGSSARISQCLVGTNVLGTEALANGGTGIALMNGAVQCEITQNLASGNGGSGILLIGAGTTRNLVRGNLAGVNINNSAGIPNHDSPIIGHSGASDNVFEGNTIFPR